MPGIGSPGQRVERHDNELGHGSWVCVPADSPDPPGAEETPQAPVRNDRPHCPVLAQPDLVQAGDGSLSGSAQSDPGLLEPSEELGDTQALPGTPETAVDCVKTLSRSFLARDFQRRWPTLPPRDAGSPLDGFTVPVLHTSQDDVLREQWIL